MKLLGLLLGVLFGAAEFFLTKWVVQRAGAGKLPVLPLLAKLVSYAAVLIPVFLLTPSYFAIRFGIGAGAGVLGVGLIVFLNNHLREKR